MEGKAQAQAVITAQKHETSDLSARIERLKNIIKVLSQREPEGSSCSFHFTIPKQPRERHAAALEARLPIIDAATFPEFQVAMDAIDSELESPLFTSPGTYNGNWAGYSPGCIQEQRLNSYEQLGMSHKTRNQLLTSVRDIGCEAATLLLTSNSIGMSHAA